MQDHWKLEEILSDRVHGSTFLAKKILELIVVDNPTKSELREIKYQIDTIFSGMRIFDIIFKNLLNSDSIISEANNLSKLLETGTELLVKQLQQFNLKEKNIMTFSYSQTVKEIISSMEFEHVICMTSDPGGEGKQLAKELQVDLVQDDEGYGMIQNHQIDAILIGCDTYTSSGVIINKINTQKLIDDAFGHNIPIYILASQFKLAENILDPESELLEKVLLKTNCRIITENSVITSE